MLKSSALLAGLNSNASGKGWRPSKLAV